MQGDTLQVPVAQKVQPEVKDVSQAPQQPPPGFQTPSKPNTPTKPKKKLKLKILAILIIVLVGLGIGGFFLYRNIFVKKEVYKGVWLFGLPPNWLASNIQKMKDIGINTVFIEVIIFEVDGNRVGGIDTSHTVADIQAAHENGLRVALTTGFAPKPKWEEIDVEELNSRIIELAELAEEYNVELFAPLNEPPGNTGNWRQEILHRIKEVYHGEVVWKGAGSGPSDKATISKILEQPPGDFSGYDYIGFSSMYMPEEFLEPEELSQYADRLTLEGYSEYFEGVLDYVLAQAERDGVKGVMITEFGVMHVFDQGSWNEEEVARAYEIVLEKGKGKVAGFIAFNFLEIELSGKVPPEFLVHLKGSPKTEEVIRRWFREIL